MSLRKPEALQAPKQQKLISKTQDLYSFICNLELNRACDNRLKTRQDKILTVQKFTKGTYFSTVSSSYIFTLSNFRLDRKFQPSEEALTLPKEAGVQISTPGIRKLDKPKIKTQDQAISEEEKHFKQQMRTNEIMKFDLSKVKAICPKFISQGKLTLLIVDPNQTVESIYHRGEKHCKIFISDKVYSDQLQTLFEQLKEACEERKSLKKKQMEKASERLKARESIKNKKPGEMLANEEILMPKTKEFLQSKTQYTQICLNDNQTQIEEKYKKRQNIQKKVSKRQQKFDEKKAMQSQSLSQLIKKINEKNRQLKLNFKA